MDNHLEDIHSYYFLDPEDKNPVKPVSEIDCEIIHTLLLILQRQNSEYLFNTLSNWKKDPDQDILQRLQDYLESDVLEEEMKDKGGDLILKLIDSMKMSFVTIGDTDLHTNKIFTITKTQHHNGQRMEYHLTVNDEKYLPQNKTTWYTNLTVTFPTEDQRENEYNRIRKLLKENTMCKFLS